MAADLRGLVGLGWGWLPTGAAPFVVRHLATVMRGELSVRPVITVGTITSRPVIEGGAITLLPLK